MKILINWSKFILYIYMSELRYLDLHWQSASVNHVVTSVASALSNCNMHKCSIARRQERNIRSFTMSIAKHLMWFTSLTVTSVVVIRRRKCPTIQQKNEWIQKWPYEKDALAHESTLCFAGALIGWLWQIQNLHHWPQSKLERESKTKQREFLDPWVTNITLINKKA